MVCSRQTRGAADALRRQLVHRAQRRALGRLRRQEPAQGVLSQFPVARRTRRQHLLTQQTLHVVQNFSPHSTNDDYATYLLIRFL